MHRFGLPKFRNSQNGLRIERPRRISHAERITIGNNVTLGPGCWLIPIVGYPPRKFARCEKEVDQQQFDPHIEIGNNVTATANLQVFCQERIVVEDDVMFASNVFINDGSHGFLEADTPYKYQKIFRISPVTIKRGCWVGQNVVIMPGVTLGEMCIIGANSVVTKSLPSRSIAAGSPASIISVWDPMAGAWAKIHRSGQTTGALDPRGV